MNVTRVTPLTIDLWPDLVDLFGERGACGGCWCMWWRVAKADYQAHEGNRRALRTAVDNGEPVGLLGYTGSESAGERAAGWCAVAPRRAYRRLERAVVGRGGGDEPGRWAAPCFFVRPGHRRQGLTDALLRAACEHSREQGATVIEGYPTTSPRASSSDLYVGTRGLFERHGFTVARKPTESRLVMERRLT